MTEQAVLVHNGNGIVDVVKGMPEVKPGAIGLGLDESLADLNRAGATSYQNWFQKGFTKIPDWKYNLDSYAFSRAFIQAAENASQILFDVTGVDLERAAAEGVLGFISSNYANAEIAIIKSRADLLAKTIFFTRL